MADAVMDDPDFTPEVMDGIKYMVGPGCSPEEAALKFLAFVESKDTLDRLCDLFATGEIDIDELERRTAAVLRRS